MLTFYCGRLKLNVIKWLSSYHLHGEEEKIERAEFCLLSRFILHLQQKQKQNKKVMVRKLRLKSGEEASV